MDARRGGLLAEEMASDQRVGSVELGDEATPGDRLQAFVEARQVAWRAIAREENAPAGVEHVADRLDELLLRLVASGEELDVFDDEELTADYYDPFVPAELDLLEFRDNVCHNTTRPTPER